MLLAAGACSDGEESLGPAGTVGPAPTTTSTTARPIDPGVIPEDPADIDETYVQAVVDALFEVDAKATKIFVETKAPDDRAIEYLRAIYLQEELDRQLNVWFKSLARGSETLLPGALQHEIVRFVGRASDCLFFEVERDYSKTTSRDAAPRRTYLGLTPKSVEDDPQGFNPTAWMLFSDGFNEDGSQPEDPCAGR
jgi:hypothetical protein